MVYQGENILVIESKTRDVIFIYSEYVIICTMLLNSSIGSCTTIKNLRRVELKMKLLQSISSAGGVGVG